MEHSTDSFVAAGGVTIFTQTWRPVSTPKARIVLVHGYGEHSGRYEHVAEALTGAGYIVAAFDHRGHGRSSGPRGLFRDLGDLAHDLTLFRQELGRDDDASLPQIVLGHSVGGAVALEHLITAHEPVVAGVFSGPYVRNAADVAAPLKILAPVLGKLLPTLPTQKVPAEAVSRDPQVVAAYEADPLVFHSPIPAGTAAAMLAIEKRIMSTATRINERALIMHGTDDALAAFSGSEELVRLIPDAELKRYEGLHHEIFNEPEQKEVLADLIEWLDAALER